ncbi:hemin uptake protein HemP [Roseomonas frigidaquae]|uniref:Hemin uptake protein HemP n=1 Tax=Falsiroseomonas frigidaquae TaxID=487318 RepID=A0ABX1F5B1_9PROT|nr:hemin uptake protein HemP [Falsiroseomonas frigidaquae]NKE47513.1 hemin uptake protein HemP [Falsiroseomonas frigidaquae]
MTESVAAPGEPAVISVPVSQEVAKVQSSDLLKGARELLIQHHGDTYRLRLTSNDKLILTK